MLRPQWIPTLSELPGLALAFCLGAAALLLTRALPRSALLSDILVAMLLGAALTHSPLRRVIGLGPPGADSRYAAGLCYNSKWVLRAAIVLMGLKVRTQLFGRAELGLIGGVAATALPSAFFLMHGAAARLGVRQPMGDLLAGGTMICGASAINAIAPVVGARREEQGIAIATVFLFSVVALLTFRPIALALALSPAQAGLWSGLAVNDLSSAVAVGEQMGGVGGVMATAAKSARVLLLAPILVILALLRARGVSSPGLRHSLVAALPGFLLGYLLLAVVRAAGDRLLPGSPAWAGLLRWNQLVVDLFLVSVTAGIGLHLEVRGLMRAGARAVAVGGTGAACMAALTLCMVTAVSRGAPMVAALVGLGAVCASYVFYRSMTANLAMRAPRASSPNRGGRAPHATPAVHVPSAGSGAPPDGRKEQDKPWAS